MSGSIRARQSMAVTLMVLGLVAGSLLPAQAHYVKQDGDLYASDEHCTGGWDEISHGSRGLGYLKSETRSEQGPPYGIPGSDCGYTNSVPSGRIHVNPTLWQQGPSGERQYKCNDWGGIYSTTNTWRIQFIRDFGGLPTGGGCGGRHDYYGTWGSHAVNWNGTWYPANVGYSRWLWSGWHYLPTTPSLSNRDIALKGLDVPAAAVPQDPAWVDPHTMQAIPGKVPKYMQRFFDNAVTAEEGTPGVLTKDAVTDTSWRLVEARAPILPALSDSLP